MTLVPPDKPATRSDRRPGHFAYTQTFEVLVWADGLDLAHRRMEDIRRMVESEGDVERAATSFVDLRHRPDIDGSLNPGAA